MKTVSPAEAMEKEGQEPETFRGMQRPRIRRRRVGIGTHRCPLEVGFVQTEN